LQQAQIRFAEPGIARNNQDFLTLRLANLILGGAFASRLNQKVRDDLGLTYSISSRFEALKNTGGFEISTFTRNDKVGETIKSSLAVLKDFIEGGVTDKELDAAKALLVGQFPAAIETVDRLAFNLLILRLNGIDDSYLKDFFTNVNGISRSDVNAAIKKYFSSDKMKILVYADGTKVADQLKTIGAVETVKAQ
jgi:zinc protease